VSFLFLNKQASGQACPRQLSRGYARLRQHPAWYAPPLPGQRDQGPGGLAKTSLCPPYL